MVRLTVKLKYEDAGPEQRRLTESNGKATTSP